MLNTDQSGKGALETIQILDGAVMHRQPFQTNMNNNNSNEIQPKGNNNTSLDCGVNQNRGDRGIKTGRDNNPVQTRNPRKRGDRNGRPKQGKNQRDRRPKNRPKVPRKGPHDKSFRDEKDKKDPKPEVVDLREKMVIEPFCTPFVQKQLLMFFPHLQFSFTSTKMTHPHIIAATARTIGNKMALDILKGHYSHKYPCLDAGLSARNFGQRWIHGCENGYDAYTLAKMIKLKRKHKGKFLGRSGRHPYGPQRRTKRGATFCSCDARHCEHIDKFGCCMWVHSIYYFEPDDVAQMVYDSKSKTGVSIHHVFPLNNGLMYQNSPDSDEVSYAVHGDNVTCQVSDNDRLPYQHAHSRWLSNRDRKVEVTIKVPVFCDKIVPKKQQVGSSKPATAPAMEDDCDDVEPTAPEVQEDPLNLNEIKVESRVTLAVLDAKIQEMNTPALEVPTDEIFAEDKSDEVDPEVDDLVERLMDLAGVEDTEIVRTETVSEKKHYLTWTTFRVDSAGFTMGCRFTVVPIINPLQKDKFIPDIPLTLRGNGDRELTELMELNCVEGFKIDRVPNTNLFFSLQPRFGRQVTIPVALVTAARRELVGHTIDSTNQSHLFAKLKRIAIPKNYPGIHVSGSDLITAIPMVVNLALHQTVKDNEVLEESQTPIAHLSYMKHNHRVKFTTSRLKKLFRYGLIALCGILLILGTVALIPSFFGWIYFTLLTEPFILAALGVVGAVVLVQIFGYRGLIGLAPKVFAAEATTTSTYSVVVYVGLLWLLFRLLVYLIQMVDYSAWKAFMTNVMFNRVTIDVEGAIPFNAHVPCMETWIDIRKFPRKPGTTIEIREEDFRRHDMTRPGAYAIGICFNCSVPLVFSTSQYNLFCALVTRSIRDTPTTTRAAWTEAYNYSKEILHMMQPDDEHYPRSSVESFTLDGITYYQPERYDWDKYVARYPPNRRKKLENFRKKYLCGDWTKKQLCYTSFVKGEKLNKIGFHSFSPCKPRTIQAVSGPAKAIAGPWFLSYSYALKFTLNPLSAVWYCSGYGTEVFNSWFLHHLEHFGGIEQVFFLFADYSAYDSTQGAECIRNENQEYRRLGLCHLKDGAAVLRSKLHTTGYGIGIKYTVEGTRKSGDNDTSSGNSETTFKAFFAFLRSLSLKPLVHFVLAILGDDNFAMLARLVLMWFNIKQLKVMAEAYMLGLGFTAKVGTTFCSLKAEFLSMRWYKVGSGYCIGRKPGRVLAKIGWFLARIERPSDQWRQILKATCISMLPTGNHVPFLRVYLHVLLKLLDDVEAAKIDEVNSFADGSLHEPTVETFIEFEEFYGLSKLQEDLFRTKLEDSTKKYGLRCLIKSDSVERMLLIDNNIF